MATVTSPGLNGDSSDRLIQKLTIRRAVIFGLLLRIDLSIITLSQQHVFRNESSFVPAAANVVWIALSARGDAIEARESESSDGGSHVVWNVSHPKNWSCSMI